MARWIEANLPDRRLDELDELSEACRESLSDAGFSSEEVTERFGKPLTLVLAAALGSPRYRR
jgi:hypothetical protein